MTSQTYPIGLGIVRGWLPVLIWMPFLSIHSSALSQENEPASARADVLTALAAPIEAEFHGMGLWDALTSLQKQIGLKIHLDRANIDEVLLLSNSAPSVYLTAHGLRFDVALNIVLRPFKLRWTVKDGVVVITTPDVVSQIQEIRRYDVNHLVTTEEGSTADDLAELIRSTIDPETRDDAGGRGVIHAVKTGNAYELAVTHTLHSQLKVHQLLRKLGEPHAKRDQSLASGPARILRALHSRTEVEFVEMPLSDVADYLSALHEIRFRIDRDELERVGVDTDDPVTMDTTELRLESLLNLILRPRGLTWTVRDEELLVTTPDGAAQIQGTEVYNVSGLTSENGTSAADLANLVSSTIDPQAWTGTGGSGVIRAARFGNGQYLVVRQSFRTQLRIRQLLSKLGTSESENLKQPAVPE